MDEASNEKANLSTELESLQKNVNECKAGFLAMLNKYKKMLESEE